MKKILFLALTLLFSCSLLKAEEDGYYLSLEFGGGDARFKQSIDATANILSITTMPIKGDITANNNMNNLTLKFGDKVFFGPDSRFGFRKYLYLGYGYNSMQNISYNGDLSLVTIIPGNDESIFTGTKHTYYNSVIEYGFGIDALINILQSGNSSAGIYGGVAIGGETWIANGKEFKPSAGPGESYSNFQTILNVGARMLIKKHHGLEIGAKFYMLSSDIYKGHGYSPLMNQATGGLATVDLHDTVTTMKRPYIVHVTYSYNF